jgi:hypothetical protein
MSEPASLVYFLADLVDTDASIIRKGVVEGLVSIYHFRNSTMGILDKRFFKVVTDVGTRVTLSNSFAVLYNGQLFYNIR